MALSQSALSELLDEFCASDGVDLVRESVRMVMPELIETEAEAAGGSARAAMNGPRIGCPAGIERPACRGGGNRRPRLGCLA